MKEGKSFEMAIKIRLRRFTSVLLCCLLVFCSLPVQVHASDPVTAASLAITGGQLAGAGLSGEAALSLSGPVGAVVGVTLGALGVNAYVSKAAQEAGKTRTRFVLDKLVIWGAQAGYTQEQLYSKIAQGISVAVDGTIQLSNETAKTIQQFGNWLFQETAAGNEMVVPEILSGGKTASLGDYNFIGGALQSLGSTEISFPCTGSGPGGRTMLGFNFGASSSVGSDIFVGLTTDGYLIMASSANLSSLSANDRRLNYFASGGYSNWSSFNSGPRAGDLFLYSLRYSILFSISSSTIPSLGVTSSQFWSSISGKNWEITESLPTQDVFVGQESTWDANKDLLNPSAEDTPIVLNPDLLNPIIDSLTDGQQATMGIVDYLEALQDAWDHALDDVQTAIGTITDSLTGIQEQIAIPQTAVENPSITNPSVTPDTTPILNPSDVNPGTAITGLSFDLTNIFPFCIPFDIYAALNLLDAEPVAPSYHVHLEWPYNIIIDFTIDLSPFDQVAAVARTMETFIFIIGLAVMTRSIFIRG